MLGPRALGIWAGACLLGGVVAAAAGPPSTADVQITATGDDEDAAAPTRPAARPATTSTTTTSAPTTTAAPPTVETTVPATTPATIAPRAPVPATVEPAPADRAPDPGPAGSPVQVAGNGVWVVAADGSGLRQVAPRCESSFVRWVDGGRALAVGDGMRGVDVHGLDGSHLRIDAAMGFPEWDASATGRFVVTSAFEGDLLTTVVWGLDGSRTVIATGWATIPVVAPDGRSIHLFRHQGHRIVDPSGAVLQDWRATDFTPAMAHAQFSPDGRRILGHAAGQRPAVLDLDSGAVTVMPDLSPGHVNRWFDDQRVVAGLPELPGTPARLVLRDWRTGATTELTDRASWPSTQPGPGLVAFNSFRTSRSTIDVVQGDGGGRRPLVAAEPGTWLHPLRWSPDGQLLAFGSCT